MKKFQMKVFQGYLMLYRETVSILTDKGAITKYDAHTGIQSGSVQSAMHERSTYIAKALQVSGLDTLNEVNTVTKNYRACRICEEIRV